MNEIEQLQDDWNDLAIIDPLWAIASDPTKAFNQWNAEEFFEAGQSLVNEALEIVNSSGVVLKKGTVLDFGCGVGRLTQALAKEFDTCYGIDIAPRMIELANQFNRFGDRCKYIPNSENDLRIFDSNFFDLIYTIEVLQHMPHNLARNYLKEFIRILKNGGCLVFQVPMQRQVRDEKTAYLKSLPRYHPKRVLNKLQGILIGHDVTTRYYRLRRIGFSKRWLYDKFGLRPAIQMNFFNEAEIYQLMTDSGAEVVHVVEREHLEMLDKIFVVVKAL